MGLEIEVPWRGYFPDLWTGGFSNISDEQMAAITAECSRREAVLLPRLRKTVECGVKQGCDRYWEFAFDPVTDVSIVVNQVNVLREAGLIPIGGHSLHITLGGLRVDRYSYFIALAMEAMSVSANRVLSGYLNDTASKGWARKGKAGVFEKEGSYDMMHDYVYGTEVRMAQLPDIPEQLFTMLNVAQRMAVDVYHIQCGVLTNKRHFDTLVGELATVLFKAGFPIRRWGNPHEEPKLWESFAEALPSLRGPVEDALRKYDYI